MSMSKPTAQEIKNNLAQFCGTDDYHKYMGNIIITDGVKYMADTCGAFWFLDIMWSVLMTKPAIKAQPMLVMKLKKTGEDTAVVTIEEGNKKVLYTQDINFTDFPLEEITVWANVDGQYRVILLPSEY